ncbi:MAG TPA: flavin reductase family protein, partial [Solirubrobacteraceae bacterium]|nr:flavin reductase family protein [Solirubrobacteraceae bacterium]
MSLSSISPEAFRRCVGEFATGVTVVCAEHEAGPAGMTLNAFTSVSLNPLLVLVSLGHGSRTLDAVHGAERFGLSILERGQRDAAIAFA